MTIHEKIFHTFKHIIFHEDGHKYIDTNTGLTGKSSTGYKKTVVPPFNSAYWLPKKAKEYGLTVEQVKFAWDFLADLGKERGSAIHKYIEDRDRGKVGIIDYSIPLLDKLIKQADSYLEDYKDDYVIGNEIVIGNKYCFGQIDKLVKRNGRLGIVDFKNDKEFSKTSRFGNLLKPFNRLPKCNYSEYRIQLSIYKWIFEEETGIKIDFMEIIWLSPLNDEYHLIEVEPIPNSVIKNWIENFKEPEPEGLNFNIIDLV